MSKPLLPRHHAVSVTTICLCTASLARTGSRYTLALCTTLIFLSALSLARALTGYSRPEGSERLPATRSSDDERDAPDGACPTFPERTPP